LFRHSLLAILFHGRGVGETTAQRTFAAKPPRDQAVADRASAQRGVAEQRFLALMLAGWRVVRFTWRQVFHEADQVTATVRALLEQRLCV
jgi:hypothetical protein